MDLQGIPSCFFFFLILFIYLFMAVLGLRFCARAFSSCGKWGPSSSRCAGLSLSWPLLLRSTGSRRADPVIVAHGPSCSVACGIFPDQGSNPCPLHWQADSQPLRHQGSPYSFKKTKYGCFFLDAQEWVVNFSPKNAQWAFSLPWAPTSKSLVNFWPWSTSGLRGCFSLTVKSLCSIF